MARCYAPGGRPTAKISWRSQRLGELGHLAASDQSILSIIPSRFMHKAGVESC